MPEPSVSCVRVVQFGWNVPALAGAAFEAASEGSVHHGGRDRPGRSRFEPKVGGAGHLVLDYADGTHFARIVIEPDGSCVNLVAVLVPVDFEQQDEQLLAHVRHWIERLFEIRADVLAAPCLPTASDDHPPTRNR